MKKIKQKRKPEIAEYFSDFTGKSFKEFPPITINIEHNYGSTYDGATYTLHLSDTDMKELLVFLATKLTPKTKKHILKIYKY